MALLSEAHGYIAWLHTLQHKRKHTKYTLLVSPTVTGLGNSGLRTSLAPTPLTYKKQLQLTGSCRSQVQQISVLKPLRTCDNGNNPATSWKYTAQSFSGSFCREKPQRGLHRGACMQVCFVITTSKLRRRDKGNTCPTDKCGLMHKTAAIHNDHQCLEISTPHRPEPGDLKYK